MIPVAAASTATFTRQIPENIPCFSSEEQLVNLFKSIFQSHKLSTHGLLDEFECGDGIADMVMYHLRKDWESNLTLGGIPSRWAYALVSLPYRKNFSTEEFIFHTGAGKQTALRILYIFSELEFCIKKPKENTWVKIKQPRPVVNRVYAIEAKLRNWNRALTQAVRYRDYSEQSWVLLDENRIQPALENINQFHRLNIGLSAISTKGKITSYFTPKSLHPKDKIRFWQANAQIAHKLASTF